MARRAVRTDPQARIDRLRSNLESIRLDPFVDFLEVLFRNQPDAAEIAKYARKRPDVWVGMVKTFAGLVGYSEKSIEMKHTGVLGHIHAMSDAQLREAAASLLAGKTIEGEASPADEEN